MWCINVIYVNVYSVGVTIILIRPQQMGHYLSELKEKVVGKEKELRTLNNV